MQADSPYALIHEMLETSDILRRFDSTQIAGWADAMTGKRLLVTGEGSSRIFPAKNLIALALQTGHPLHIATEGARQAAEYDLRGFNVLAGSNSGRTRELIALCEKLTGDKIDCYAVTANAGSPLTMLATDSRVLTCGAEKAVAASKSVVEHALLYQSLLGGNEWRHQGQAAEYCGMVLAQTFAPALLDAIAAAPVIYFSGRNNGVAEELTLKANEIARRKSDYLEGTYALHGIEEIMRQDEVVILIAPFTAEIEKYQKVLEQGTGIKIIAISAQDTPFDTIRIPALNGFDAYFQLLAGWNILVSVGLACGIDIDKPERVRKVGNAI